MQPKPHQQQPVPIPSPPLLCFPFLLISEMAYRFLKVDYKGDLTVCLSLENKERAWIEDQRLSDPSQCSPSGPAAEKHQARAHAASGAHPGLYGIATMKAEPSLLIGGSRVHEGCTSGLGQV